MGTGIVANVIDITIMRLKMTQAVNTALKALCCLLSVLLLPSCSEDVSQQQRMLIFLDNLTPLNEESNYAVWSHNGESVELLGRFNTSSSSANLSYRLTDTLSSASKISISVELGELENEEPSGSVLLAGDITGLESSLSVGHPDALGNDFSDSTATYRLTTPSTIDEDDFFQGIWWFDPQMSPETSLFLPPLPEGWSYEAWINDTVTQTSLGKFSDAERVDSDGSGATAGPDQTPNFPGQDFIDPPKLMSHLSAYITIEPRPDNSAEPFMFRVLLDKVIEEISVNQPMANIAKIDAPRGKVVITDN